MTTKMMTIKMMMTPKMMMTTKMMMTKVIKTKKTTKMMTCRAASLHPVKVGRLEELGLLEAEDEGPLPARLGGPL